MARIIVRVFSSFDHTVRDLKKATSKLTKEGKKVSEWGALVGQKMRHGHGVKQPTHSFDVAKPRTKYLRICLANVVISPARTPSKVLVEILSLPTYGGKVRGPELLGLFLLVRFPSLWLQVLLLRGLDTRVPSYFFAVCSPLTHAVSVYPGCAIPVHASFVRPNRRAVV